MKRLLALLAVLTATPVFAQETPIYCVLSTLTVCNTVSNPGNHYQGDPAWSAFGKLNAWGTQLGLFANDPANEVLATPSGASGIPSLRALVGADIPPINLAGGDQNGGVTGILPVAEGGTGITSITANYCLVGNSGGTGYTFIPCAAAGSTYQVNGTGLSNSSTINFENSAATNGLTLAFLNPSLGNVQLELLGQLSLTTGVSGILPVANGGTGTASPGLVAGSNCTVTGTWPDQTVNCTGGGGSGTVDSGTSGQVGCYAASGTAISGCSLAHGLAISGSTLGISEPVEAPITTSTYTLQTTDCGQQIPLENASGVTVTVPGGSTFDNCQVDFTVPSGYGTSTLTGSSVTLGGHASISAAVDRQCGINFDGTNWQVIGCTALVSGGGSFTSQFVGLTSGYVTPSGTQYIGWLAGGLGSGENSQPAPRGGTISTLYATSPTLAASTSLQITLRDNATSESVTCTIAASTSSCNDLTHTFSFAAGDKLDWQTIQTGTGTAGTYNISFLVQ